MACELHTVQITDRGGGRIIATLNSLNEVQWNRQLDDKSYASVAIEGEACREQSKLLGQIEPRRHEMVIHRNGVRVWEGPIVSVSRRTNRIVVSAMDVLEYLDGRPITKYWPGPENGGPTLMGERIEEIIRFEMLNAYVPPGIPTPPLRHIPAWDGESGLLNPSVNPPINVIPFLEVHPGTVLTRTETFPFEMMVYEHLSTLAEGGLDYTTVGRKILIWDSSLSIGRTRDMVSADFGGDVEVFSSGVDLVGVMHVVGGRDEDFDNPLPPNSTANVGSALRDVTYYGPWARLHTRSEESGDATQEALNTQAMRISAGRNPVPIEVDVGNQATIKLDDRLTINHLVAGVDVPVIANVAGGTVNQVQRFRGIYVTETSGGETITATLISAGGV